MAAPETFTSDYFRREVMSLRKRWGEKSFWENTVTAARGLQAVAFVYMNLAKPNDDDAVIWNSVVTEFTRRLELTVNLRVDEAISKAVAEGEL